MATRREKEARERERNAERLLNEMRSWFQHNKDKNHNYRLVHEHQIDFSALETSSFDVKSEGRDGLVMVLFSRRGTGGCCEVPEISTAHTIWRP